MRVESDELYVARVFLELPLEKRKRYLQKMWSEGLSPIHLPIPARQAGTGPLSLSFAQQRQWFLWQWEPTHPAYHIPVALRLKGVLDVEALRRSFESLIQRHETLRTTFRQEEEQLVQHIHENIGFQLGQDRPPAGVSADLDGWLKAHIETEVQKPFDLETGPLLRACLLALGDEEHVLIVTLHHIVTDGWSNSIMIDELVHLYDAYSQQQAARLPELPIQYADYAIWQRKWMEAGEQQRQIAYWRERLGTEQPVLELPADHPRPVIQSHAGKRLEIALDAALVKKLGLLARSQGATLFMALLASFQALLHRYTGQTEIRVGVPVANRTHADTERLIGFFVNTQVLKADVEPGIDFASLLEQVKTRALEAQAHQDLPFEQLVEALQARRSLSHNPLFQVMYNHQAAVKGEARHLAGLMVEGMHWESHTAQFDLTLDTFESEEGVQAAMTYASDLFEAATIERLARHWVRLLESVVEHPGRSIDELALLSENERHQILFDWNRTAVARPGEPCVHRLVEAQAARTPDAVAVVFGERQLSYAELDQQANRLAHRLAGRGVGPDVLVGIAVERSLEMVVGLLAILKAGGAYVPLDPAYPRERLAYMVEDSGIDLLLTQAALRERLPSGFSRDVTVLELEQELAADRSAGAQGPVTLVQAANLAYVIYTSGSTGRPKGVEIRHDALFNHMQWMQGQFGLQAHDRVLHKTAFSFDASVWEIWLPLLSGARLCLAPADLLQDLPQLWAEVERQRISVLQLVPSLLQALLPFAERERIASLRILACGGEALSARLVEQVADCWEGTLVNLYGPTEATIDACSQVVIPGDTPSIGRPIDNARVHVLAADMDLLPAKVAGELVIAGQGLARGYRNRPGLTAERFVPDPYDGSEQGGGRLYRTGDLARHRDDGVIEYIGRIDHQVKIRGLRIELGEIEARLNEQDSVREAVVLAQDGPSGAQLVGYVVAHEGHEVDVPSFKAALKAQLPDYMVPAHLLVLDRLPLTSNGKLDRKALPKPDVSLLQQGYVAPQSELEQQVAAIWAEVLKLERVGLTDNFFELGGDSIISIQVVSRARQAGIRFTPKELFQHQTVQGLASVARKGEEGALLIDQGSVTGETPLLPVHQSFFEQAIAQRHHWNQSLLLTPGRTLDGERVEQALQALVAHHDALRVSFFEVSAGGWQARYRDVSPQPGLVWHATLQGADELQALCDEAQRSLELRDGPLLRGVLADLEDGSQRLLLVIHHLAVDGVSWRILLEDLQTAYTQLEQDQPLRLAAKTSSVRAWAEQLRAHASDEARVREREYWTEQLRDVVADLPCDDPAGSLRGSTAGSACTHLDAVHTRKLLQQAPAAYRTQVNDLLLTALARVIARWTGQPEVLVQLEGHGREDLFESIDLTRTVGWFTSLFPVKLTPAAGLDGSIKQIKEQLRAVPDKGIGFGALRYLGDEQTRQALAGLPQPRITFNYLGQFDGSFGGEQTTEQAAFLVPAAESGGDAQDPQAPLGNWLSINGQVYGGELELNWSFSREMFSESTVEHLAHEYAEELKRLIEHCVEAAPALTPSDFPLAGLSQAQLDGMPVAAGAVEDIYPLSPMQQGMLFHTLYQQEAGDYINQMRVDVQGLDVANFRQAWQAAMDSHAILRTGFVWQGLEEAVQVVFRQVELPFAELDWRARSEQAALDELAAAQLDQGFELSQAPLLRLVLVRTGEDRHHLIYTSHHILMDGWSNSQLLGEVLQRYAGQAPERATGKYRDYIAWLQRQDRAASEAFWTAQLEDLEAPTRLAQAVRADAPAPAAGRSHGELFRGLDEAQTQRLNAFARQQRVTVNTLVQAAWLLLLQRYTGQATVAFGATVSGRPAQLKGVEQQVGLFINTLPVVATPRPEQPLGAWLQQVQAQNLALREQEHTPLFEIQRWAGLGGEALFDTLLVFENYPLSQALEQGAPQGLVFGAVENHEQTNYPLSLAITIGQQLSLHYGYAHACFEPAQVEKLAESFECLLTGMITGARLATGELESLSGDERARALAQAGTPASYPDDRIVHQLIEARARQNPDALSIISEGCQLTYGQLDAQANQWAHRLIEHGVGPEVRVAVAMPRSAQSIVAFLAVLKAGGAYVPLDLDYPHDRLAYIMQDSQAHLLLTQQTLLDRFSEAISIKALAFDAHDGCAGYSRAAPSCRVTRDNLAYVIYTSGSTGLPKGVAVSHGPLAMHCLATAQAYEMTEADCELLFLSFAFDGAHERWLTMLSRGGRLLVRGNELWTPEQTLENLHEHKVSMAGFPPMYLHQLAECAAQGGHVPDVRLYSYGGDAMPRASFELVRSTLKPRLMINGYGPTETVVTPLVWKSAADDRCELTYAPIGRPVGNRTAYVLGSHLELLAQEMSGELFIGGQGVAREYLHRPALTAERFVPDPFGSDGEAGGRLYRTGDLVRSRKENVIEYIGRIDQQVKIRGFRIELGEIEACLAQQPSVRDAVVLARESGQGQRLVAWIIAADSQAGIGGDWQTACRESLKAALKRSLPDYMVPAHLVFLDQWPLTPNGKLDRKALPEPDANGGRTHHVAPGNELEQDVADIWASVLNLEAVGMDDNFFELGGHSLLAMKVTTLVQSRLGIDVALASLFSCRNLQEYVSAISQEAPMDDVDFDELQDFLTELERA